MGRSCCDGREQPWYRTVCKAEGRQGFDIIDSGRVGDWADDLKEWLILPEDQ